MKKIEVHWVDAAFILNNDEETVQEWLEKGGEVAKTIGYLYKENKKVMIVCSEVFEDGSIRGLTVIPKGMIYKIQYLKAWTGVH